MEKYMLVCIAGKNNIAVDVLEYLISVGKEEYELGIVCNRNETGKDSWQKSLRNYANKMGIREYKLHELYDIDDLVFISLEFDRIITPSYFKNARLYNIHFSLLPAYKGMYTSAIPILNGEKYVGVTFHKIDTGIDTGDIIYQERFEVDDKITSRELYMKYILYGTEMVIKHIDEVILNKNLPCKQQPSIGSTYYSKNYINYSNIIIDLFQTAEVIGRQIRAFNFREYQIPEVFGKKVIDYHITDIKSLEKPGTIISENEQEMRLSTIDYDIVLYFDRFEELLVSCKNGDLENVIEICVSHKYTGEFDEHGRTPLIVARECNHKEIVDYLLSQNREN